MDWVRRERKKNTLKSVFFFKCGRKNRILTDATMREQWKVL